MKRAGGCVVDLLDFEKEPLALFNPETAYHGPGFAAMKSRVEKADVFLLGTPDYHGSISSTSMPVSLLPAVAFSQSPRRRATPVRTSPSPITKRPAMPT